VQQLLDYHTITQRRQLGIEHAAQLGKCSSRKLREQGKNIRPRRKLGQIESYAGSYSCSLDRVWFEWQSMQERWSNYVRGVAHVLHAEGLKLTGFDGVIHSTVPMSSGLSSSAALECVTATVFVVVRRMEWRGAPGVRTAALTPQERLRGLVATAHLAMLFLQSRF
jgi:mevalonate kinase